MARGARAGITLLVGAALVAIGLVAAGTFSASGSRYRTAVAAAHDIDTTVNGVATLEPVSQASVAFPVAGTVASVDVSVGSAVAAGQTLATLDPTNLTVALHQKQAALAQTQLTLYKAMNGQSVGSGSLRGANSTFTGSGSVSAAVSAAAPTDAAPIVLTAAIASGEGTNASGSGAGGVSSAQQGVRAAQKAVDTALAGAQTAMQNAESVCSAAGVTTNDSSGSSGSMPTTTPSSTTVTTTTTVTPTTPTTEAAGPDASALAACQSAISDVLTAQQNAASVQSSLASASNALDAMLTARADQSGSVGSGAGRTGSTTSGAGGSGSTPAGAGLAGGSSARAAATPSSADLAAYQQAVDAADANVTVAQQAVAQATIVSPIAGTVVAMGITPGDSVSAASTSSTIVVKSPGGYEASTNIDVDQIPKVHIGQPATLVPDATRTPITAKVVSISTVPSSTTATATNYLVVVSPTVERDNLDNGSTGSLSIVTGSVHATLAVPTSAIMVAGARHTVDVMKGSKPVATTVQVGAVGTTWTEVMSGLTAGDRVVLADMHQPLPTSATSSSNATTNRIGTTGRGTGGFGGGGGFGGLGGGGGLGRGGGQGRAGG